MKKWIEGHPSLVLVLAINLAWIVVALLAPPSWAPYLWHGEESGVERVELALIVGYMGVWSWIAWRARDRLPRWLALLMVAQLLFMLSEEMDWCYALRLPHRNLRMAARVVIPEILDTPLLSAYLLWFLFWPLVPLRGVQAWLERTTVRAERRDAWAVLAGIAGSLVVLLVAGDHELGELHQLIIYAVLGVITARIVRRTKTA